MIEANPDIFKAFDYDLPGELIATRPAGTRRASRLLLATRGGGEPAEAPFSELPGLLRSGDLLVINDSRVLPARMIMHRPESAGGEGGGRIEILLVRPDGDGAWLAMARPVRRLRTGDRLIIAGREVEILSRDSDGYLRLRGCDADLLRLATDHGEMPLPPYIEKRRSELPPDDYEDMDRTRYQTVYARDTGSVAAPTAGLHFDSQLLSELADAGVGLARVTLHVGPGTFRPPTDRDYADRRLHPEIFRCPPETLEAIARTRASGGRIIAVGTTTLRVMETIAGLGLDRDGDDRRTFGADDPDRPPVFSGTARRAPGAGPAWEVQGMTRLFLAPPDEIRSVDALITNFHLPRSSLLMLVAAFLGAEAWRPAYDYAVRGRFRFYSYGDAMLIQSPPAPGARAKEGA